MPRRAACPACAAKVKVPDDTPANTAVACPACDESFVPPWLRMKVVEEDEEGYDPEKAERYKMRQAEGRSRPLVKRTGKSQAEMDDEIWKPSRGGPENALLIIGLVLAVAFPVGYFLAKWAARSNSGMGEVIIVMAAAALLLLITGVVFFRRKTTLLDRIFGKW